MAVQLLKGNVAFAEAAVRYGLQAYFGYPITPQSEALEHLSGRMLQEDAFSCRRRARLPRSTWSMVRLAVASA